MKSNFHCSIQKEVCHKMKVFHSPLNQGLKEGCKFLDHAAFQAIKTKASIFLISSHISGCLNIEPLYFSYYIMIINIGP